MKYFEVNYRTVSGNESIKFLEFDKEIEDHDCITKILADLNEKDFVLINNSKLSFILTEKIEKVTINGPLTKEEAERIHSGYREDRIEHEKLKEDLKNMNKNFNL